MLKRKTIHAENEPPNKGHSQEDSNSSHGAGGGHDESNWLISYADMMTLLCGFFIMLFSMAKMDTPKYDSFKEALAKQFGGTYESPTQDLVKGITQALKDLNLQDKASVKADSNGISVVFQSTIFFETLSTEVTREGHTILEKLIEVIESYQKEKNKIYRIIVEGHTDNRPVNGGIYPSNWELSGARAARVVRMFLHHNFKPDHLIAIGYADTHPQTLPSTPNGAWSETILGKNRRVVIRILEPNVDAIPFPEDTTKSSQPTTQPSNMPSILPSSLPSGLPSSIPLRAPVILPSISPSGLPSSLPSGLPSSMPSPANTAH